MGSLLVAAMLAQEITRALVEAWFSILIFAVDKVY